MTAHRPSPVLFATLGTPALAPAFSTCPGTLSESGSTVSSASAPVSPNFTSSGPSSSSGPSGQANTATGALIDVRTPEEFADDHLKGVTNIGFSGSDFTEKVSEPDKGGEYTPYCRPGRRSGLALEAMKAAGFTKMTSTGNIEQASEALGLDIVRDRARLGKDLRWAYRKDSVESVRIP